MNTTPLWWDDAAPQPAPAPVPERCDVAVIGSGYCGLTAARALAAAGLSVVVLDSGDPGFGASSRNSGHVGGAPKLPPDIDRRFGVEGAAALRAEWREANAFFHALIADLNVDYVRSGRFVAAHTPAAYDGLLRKAEAYRRDYCMSVRDVARAAQRAWLGTDAYHGGIVLEDAGSLHPAKLHAGVRRLAEAAGATLCGQAHVSRIERSAGGFRLTTARGTLRAARLIAAVNGYAGPELPAIRRRVIPVTPFMIATEELPLQVIADILPSNVNGGDTKRLLYAFRRDPTGRRIVFTARPGGNDMDEREAAPALHRMLCGLWPALAPYRVTHSWKGFIGFTFDFMPGMGERDGIHFAAGCQGAGVVIMTYLGHRIAQKMLGHLPQPSAFELASFPTRPFYAGAPWFLPTVESIYRFLDRREWPMPGNA